MKRRRRGQGLAVALLVAAAVAVVAFSIHLKRQALRGALIDQLDHRTPSVAYTAAVRLIEDGGLSAERAAQLLTERSGKNPGYFASIGRLQDGEDRMSVETAADLRRALVEEALGYQALADIKATSAMEFVGRLLSALDIAAVNSPDPAVDRALYARVVQKLRARFPLTPEQRGRLIGEMKLIPRGEFQLDGQKVEMHGFEIGVHEVTRGQYRTFLSGDEVSRDDDTLPMDATIYMARSFAAGLGARLPTAAEWQFAASGGGRFSSSRPCGERITELERFAWLNEGGIPNRPPTLYPVGTKAPCLGLHDLYGNVAEVTAEWSTHGRRLSFGPAADGPVDAWSPRAPMGTANKVTLGGDARDTASAAASARTVVRRPPNRTTGIRLARDPPR